MTYLEDFKSKFPNATCDVCRNDIYKNGELWYETKICEECWNEEMEKEIK